LANQDQKFCHCHPVVPCPQGVWRAADVVSKTQP